MAIYKQGSKKHISWDKSYKRHKRVLLLLVLILLGAVSFVTWDLGFSNKSPEPVTSKTTVTSVTFNGESLSTPYFRFTDSGVWEFAKSESTNGTFIWRKYLGKSKIVQHQLIVYVNKTPIPLELASPLALPVTISGSTLQAGNLSRPCGELYGNDLHKVRLQKVDSTTILCDPDLRQHKVLLGQSGGDYRLKLQRSNGAVASYIIIYQDQRLNPDNDTLMQVVNSFQAI